MPTISTAGRIRHRMAKTLSSMSEPSVDVVSLALPVSILTTNPVECLFPATVVAYTPPSNFILRLPAPNSPQPLLLPSLTQEPSPGGISIARPSCVESLELLTSSETDNLECLGFEDTSTVSENHFTPLLQDKIDGKNFITEKFDGRQREFQWDDLGPSCGARSGSDRNGITRPHCGPDKWDLLLPLLQPPIDHRFVDVLEFPSNKRPRPYQWEGIKFLVERESALLGDDMGTGKTAQSALACRLLFQRGDVRRVLVVAKNGLLSQWDGELETWAPALKTSIVRGTPDYRKSCWKTLTHVYLTTYDTLRNDIDEMVAQKCHAFDLVILDEAHRIKNKDTGSSKALRRLDCRYKWALSGTPIQGHISHLSAIFEFLRPGLFPRNVNSISAFKAKELIKPYFLRRTRIVLGKEIPACTEEIVPLLLSEEQQLSYDQIEQEGVSSLRASLGSSFSKINILALFTKLKQICNRDPETGKSAKMEWLLDKLPEIREADDKILIFSNIRKSNLGGIDWLVEQCVDYGALNYSEADTYQKKERIVEEFKKNPECEIFVGNPVNAGEGLNGLVVANQVVHFDQWWNPFRTDQATGRAHRPGQLKPVFVYHLWVKNTIEDLVFNKIEKKRRLFSDVIDDLTIDVDQEPSEDDVRDVYNALLKKHGFEPIAGPNDETIRNTLDDLTPTEFEELTGSLYHAMGFATRVTRQSGDGGVDVIASRDVGSSREKIAIQCKHEKASLGRPVLQNLLGVISSDPSYTYGLAVTSSLTASRQALDFIRENGRIRIITRNELLRLLTQFKVPIASNDSIGKSL